MKDGIIKGTGNSRYLKGAGWPATYAEFKAMAEAGTLPFDLNGINAAGWQQIGDALNKGNLLDDFSCKLVGIELTAVPSDAFSKLALGTGKYGYGVTVLFNGSPLANATVTGISTINGSGTLVTDSNGLAIGVSTSAAVSITVTPREINLFPKTIAVTASNAPVANTVFNIEEMEAGTIVTVAASRAFSFTPDVAQADFCLVGAGASGYRLATTSGSIAGGLGGATTNALNRAILAGDIFSAVIGAAGQRLTSGSGSVAGGATNVLLDGATIMTAAGGSTAGGNGQSSTTNKFNESTLGLAGGGSGGAGGGNGSGLPGGLPGGGRGSFFYISGENIYTVNASDGTTYGGGGGGGWHNSAGTDMAEPGSGYSGVLYVRWRKAA